MMKSFAAVLCVLPLMACASMSTPHRQVSRATEVAALRAAETAYAEAWAAYNAAGSMSPQAKVAAHNKLAEAHSALEATRNAFETDGAPTFMDQAVAARRLADEAKAAAS